MTSERQRAANRRNARRSTGPRTRSGRAVSSKNALRHGLSARLGGEFGTDPRVEGLARIIAGPEAGSSQLHYAHIIAAATLQITRIRALRTTLMEPAAREREVFSGSMPKRVRWRRHYKSGNVAFDAIAEKASIDPGDGTSFGTRFFKLAAPLERIPPPPSGPDAPLVILDRFIDQVIKLDRYEDRELARRKAALRALDALRKFPCSQAETR